MDFGLGGGRRDWPAHLMVVVYFIFGECTFLGGFIFADRLVSHLRHN